MKYVKYGIEDRLIWGASNAPGKVGTGYEWKALPEGLRRLLPIDLMRDYYVSKDGEVMQFEGKFSEG